MQFEEVGAPRDSPIRIIGIDDDCDVEVAHVLEPRRFDHASAGGGEGRRVAAIGRSQYADRAARRYA